MIEHKFKIGQKVIYTNIYGVCWGIKTIEKLEKTKKTEEYVASYLCDGTSTPWYSVKEEYFQEINDCGVTIDKKCYYPEFECLKWNYKFLVHEISLQTGKVLEIHPFTCQNDALAHANEKLKYEKGVLHFHIIKCGVPVGTYDD